MYVLQKKKKNKNRNYYYNVLCLQTTYVWVSYLAIIFVMVFVVAFAVGPGSIPWFLVSELFNSSARPLATSIAVGVNWTANFVVGLGFLPLQVYYCFYRFDCIVLSWRIRCPRVTAAGKLSSASKGRRRWFRFALALQSSVCKTRCRSLVLCIILFFLRHDTIKNIQLWPTVVSSPYNRYIL